VTWILFAFNKSSSIFVGAADTNEYVVVVHGVFFYFYRGLVFLFLITPTRSFSGRAGAKSYHEYVVSVDFRAVSSDARGVLYANVSNRIRLFSRTYFKSEKNVNAAQRARTGFSTLFNVF